MPKTQLIGHWARIARAFTLFAFVLVPAAAQGQSKIVKEPERAWPLDGLSARALTFSPDGNILALACTDKSVVLLSMATGRQLHHLPKHESDILQISFAPDGARLLVGTSTREGFAVKAWNVLTGKEAAVFPLDRAGSLRAISPDGKWVVSVNGSPSTVAHIWDIESAKKIATLDGGKELEDIRCAAFSSDGKTIGLGGARAHSRVVVFSCPTFKIKNAIETGPFDAFSLSAHGNLIVCSGSTIQLWDVETRGKLGPRNLGSNYLAALSPDGSLLATFPSQQGVALWSTVASRKVVLLQYGKKAIDSGNQIGNFSPDGRFFALAGRGGVCVWQVPQMEIQKIGVKKIGVVLD